MLLLIAGAFLLCLGLFSGTALVLVPLGLAPWTADHVLWVLFPVFSLLGYALLVIGAKANRARGLTVAASVLLLLLAATAALGLVLGAAAIVRPTESTLALWYVLAVAGLLGLVGAASCSRAGAAD